MRPSSWYDRNVKDRWRRHRPELISGVMLSVLKLLSATWRVTEVNGTSHASPARLICAWHGCSMAWILTNRDQNYHIFVSPSRDGELLARVAAQMGFRLIRGSTGRDGARAAIQAIGVLRRKEGTVAIAPDGPRGPARVVQDGVVAIAQRTGAEVVGAAVAGSPSKTLRNWDRTMIPLPFARVWVVFTDPFVIPPETPINEARERIRLACEDSMVEADRLARSHPVARKRLPSS